MGNSIFHALHLRLIRRFNRGLSFNVFYQFAKSIDDSSSFGGAGNTVAQNWLDLSAERGLSSFDVRTELQRLYLDIAGRRSRKSHSRRRLRTTAERLAAQRDVAAQTGNPLTARVLGNASSWRRPTESAAGAPTRPEKRLTSAGFFNLQAFTVPAAGTYGNAGRNTVPGPGVVSLNLAFARSFTFAERRRLEFRVESNNVLNHVNYTASTPS